jgi:hypothetical protein
MRDDLARLTATGYLSDPGRRITSMLGARVSICEHGANFWLGDSFDSVVALRRGGRISINLRIASGFRGRLGLDVQAHAVGRPGPTAETLAAFHRVERPVGLLPVRSDFSQGHDGGYISQLENGALSIESLAACASAPAGSMQ